MVKAIPKGANRAPHQIYLTLKNTFESFIKQLVLQAGASHQTKAISQTDCKTGSAKYRFRKLQKR